MTQKDKALLFEALHKRDSIFLIPNPWDAGSACVLAGLGFEALATSSAASAGVLGRHDGKISRDEAITHAGIIANATALPVSADLENGFGAKPAMVAETICMAAEAGLVGASIEDSTGNGENLLYDISLAGERIAAAVETARSLPFPFMVTARAENFFRGKPDLDDAIQRLLTYEKAGADVLFAPALPDLAAVRAVCNAVSKPVNFMVGIKGKSFTVPELTGAGVKRISLSASFYRAAMTGLITSAREAKEQGTFGYLDHCLSTPELARFFAD